jgi:acyl-ACP thioesterase
MYRFSSRVRYSEVNHNKQLEFSSIINYFQDCSTFHGEDIGQGIDYLAEKNRAWLLNSWQIIVKRYPLLGENITIGTSAYDFKSMYGYRNFLMQDENHNTLAIANSIWVLMDTQNMKPLKVNEEDVVGFHLEDKLEMEYAPRKINIPACFQQTNSDEIENTCLEFPAFPVIKANIDTNNHVNNGQYIKMAEEFLPSNFIIKQMRAEYRMSAVLGDMIIPIVHIADDICTIVLSNLDKKPYVIMEFIKA